MRQFQINDVLEIDECLKYIDREATQLLKSKGRVDVSISSVEKAMTVKQRGALHVWLKQVADFLNDSGLPCVQKSLFDGDDIEIDWSMEMVKELQYKRILKAMSGKTSTEQQDTVEPSTVAATMIRHFSNKGVSLPSWPSLR